MTTKFDSLSGCLKHIAWLMDAGLIEVEAAWDKRTTIRIGFPQYTDVERLSVREQGFAVEDFRDGKALWHVYDDGTMRRY